MSGESFETNIEELLKEALSPVEPSEELTDRLETALSGITTAAVDELAGWEVAAMHDPRTWVRPATAIAAGSLAGAALLIVRSRKRRRGELDISDSLKELRQLGRKTAEAGVVWAHGTGQQLRESVDDARSRLGE